MTKRETSQQGKVDSVCQDALLDADYYFYLKNMFHSNDEEFDLMTVVMLVKLSDLMDNMNYQRYFTAPKGFDESVKFLADNHKAISRLYKYKNIYVHLSNMLNQHLQHQDIYQELTKLLQLKQLKDFSPESIGDLIIEINRLRAGFDK